MGGWRGAILCAALLTGIADPYAARRVRMVAEQIEKRGVRDPELLRVMRTTPRHLFVPETISEQAYEDCPLPIGYGATISQPYIVARMTELLRPEKRHRVLEIGTGSGYQAAVLAQLTEHVWTIEIVPELARSAADRLKRLGYGNVTVREGDGYKGWPEQATFDLIMVTAAPEEVPQALLDQLAKGGRLIAPVGGAGYQELVLVEKDASGKTRRTAAGGVAFVPMVPGRPRKD